MGRKAVSKAEAVSKAVAAPPSSLEVDSQPLPSTSASPDGVVRVNNASLTDLKHALDDAVKEYFTTVGYRPSHTHENVRLALGWSSCGVALVISLYGLRVPFAQSKDVITGGVIMCVRCPRAKQL